MPSQPIKKPTSNRSDVTTRLQAWNFQDHLATVKGTKLTNTSAQRGHSYTYKVRAIASRSAANSSCSYYDTETLVQQRKSPRRTYQRIKKNRRVNCFTRRLSFT